MIPKFINSKSKETFQQKLNSEEIKSDDIVFIQDSKQIWTHDREYQFCSWSVLYNNIIETSDNKIFTAKDGEFLYKE